MNTSHSPVGSKMFSRRQKVNLNEILIFRFSPQCGVVPTQLRSGHQRPPGPCWPVLHVHTKPGSVTATGEDSSHRKGGEALKISSCTRKGNRINLSNSGDTEGGGERMHGDGLLQENEGSYYWKWGELRDEWDEFSKENNHTSVSLEIKMSRCCVKTFNSSMMCFVACTELQQFHIVKKTIEMFPLASFSQGFLVFYTCLSMGFFHMVKRCPSIVCVRAERWVQVGSNKISRRVISIC